MSDRKRGLTSEEAEKKLVQFGPNALPEKPPPSDLAIFISQLKSPLVYILVAAGTITFLLNHISDTVIIAFAVFINTVLGFLQERRASKSLSALKQLIHPKARVLRNGELKTIDVLKVVPGDIAVVGVGDKIPADGKLIEANRFFLSEAILTGESMPVGKKVEDKVFMGTIVTSGQAKIVIEMTGEETEVGKIAQKVQEPAEDTPLRKQITKFSRQLAILVFFLVLFVFVIGLLTGRDVLEIFTASVALAVSAIPEGLLVGLTVVLAIGMQRILKRKGLVRNLVSAETLGGVTTICIDKTGTLTQGKMQVVEFVGDEDKIAKQMIIANDLDDPILIAAHSWAIKKITNHKALATKQHRLDSIPFSSKDRFFASLNEWDKDGNMLFVNGAPEFLIEWSNLKKKDKDFLKQKITEMSGEGKRLIGLARKKVVLTDKKLVKTDIQKDLDWIGLLAFSDPVRSGVRSALAKTREAGIELIVITGDYPETAISVMKQLDIGVEKSNIFLGEGLKNISITQLAKKISSCQGTKLFARTTPEQKLKIVKALKENGEVVAMAGDGVNDAPALKHADIGIVVGEATDVAKETADLVLLDSNFATIVSAIEEGRGIFDNIRKIILYLMSDAFEEIVAVVGALILGLPLPVSAAQILWINLISDGFPDLALTVDPKVHGIMEKPPRSPKESLVASWMKRLILIISLAGGITALGLFIFFYQFSGDLLLSRSIAFATLGVNSLVYVFSIRTLTKPFWEESFFANKWLNLAVLAGLFLQISPFVFEPTREFLGIVALKPIHWVAVFSASVLMFIIIEGAKVVFRKKLK
jgi:Ca2+-transporting ATPase